MSEEETHSRVSDWEHAGVHDHQFDFTYMYLIVVIFLSSFSDGTVC